MITVILIVVTAALLALLRIIDSNGAVGILSGIAGYVLGGLNMEMNRRQKQLKEPKDIESLTTSEYEGSHAAIGLSFAY